MQTEPPTNDLSDQRPESGAAPDGTAGSPDLPDVLHNAGTPGEWITEDEDGEEVRTPVFIRGSYRAAEDRVRVLCKREGEDALLDTSWERVEPHR